MTAETTYEVRTDDNPTAMPMGTSTLSVHTTALDALHAVRDEQVRFRGSMASIGGGYLPRVIVEVGPDGRDVGYPDLTDDDA